MSLFDLSAAVTHLSSHSVTVRRFATDTYDANGYANARASSTFSARASVQPITGRELAHLPEGSNATEFVSIWSDKVLQLRDRITVPGRGNFEVQHLDQWVDSGNYTKAIARQLDDTEPRP